MEPVRGPVGVAPILVNAQEKTRPTKAASACRWFLKCDRTATTTVAHQTLGNVPTCQQCATWVEANR